VAFGTLLEDLVGLGSQQQFRDLLERKPEVLGSEMHEFLETIAAHEGRGIYFRRQLRLATGARVVSGDAPSGMREIEIDWDRCGFLPDFSPQTGP
jgi:hypothetical protein